MKKPVIGITAVTAFDEKLYAQARAYAEAVWGAGGEVLFLPCNPDKSNCKQLVDLVDGLIAPGGHDVDPAFYGEEKLDVCGELFRFEDEYDMELIRETVKQGKPVLGICRGMQIINVLFGGSLYQDLPTQYSKEIIHTRAENVKESFHTVNIEPDSYLGKMIGEFVDVTVNTSHHQAVKRVAEGFTVTAKAPDGTIEAIENEDASVLAVQWHPERLQYEEIYRKLMKDFVDRCRG